jgi:hypothetical protein
MEDIEQRDTNLEPRVHLITEKKKIVPRNMESNKRNQKQKSNNQNFLEPPKKHNISTTKKNESKTQT